jgi:hypothetical protein
MPQPVARLTTSAQLVAVLPHQLGYVPSECFVVVCCHEPRGRVGLTMRYDLPAAGDEPAVVDDAVRRVLQQQATRVVVVVYTEQPDAGERARRSLVRGLQEGLSGLIWTDAALVRGGRFWTYLCDDPRCGPSEGRPVDEARGSAAVQLVETEAVLRGRVVLASREALEQTLAGPSPLDAEVALVRCEAAAVLLADAVQEAGVELVAAASLTAWAAAVERFRSPPAQLGEQEAAGLAVSLADLWVRDQLAAGPEGDVPALLGLLRELLRCTPAPYDAGVSALYAWVTYGSGGGAEVTIALERALRSDPALSLAHLLSDLLRAQVPPQKVLSLARSVRGLDRRGRRVRLPRAG